MSLNCADMHTHRTGEGSLRLLSCASSKLAEYTSLEFHPWSLPDKFVFPQEEFILKLKEFNALGEIGLDRLRGPELGVQRRYLDFLLETAQACKKPVVIHNVRCESEVISALRGFPNPVLFHGFSGGVSSLERLLEAGYFVSFRKISNADVASFLRRNGLKNTGIESDDSGVDIEVVAQELSVILEMDVKNNSIETFKRFLSI